MRALPPVRRQSRLKPSVIFSLLIGIFLIRDYKTRTFTIYQLQHMLHNVKITIVIIGQGFVHMILHFFSAHKRLVGFINFEAGLDEFVVRHPLGKGTLIPCQPLE